MNTVNYGVIVHFFLIALIANASYAVTANQPDTKQKKFGTLYITSNPSGAKIIINGIETGFKTPMALTSVTPGTNTVELTLPKYLFSQRQVSVVADSVIRLSFNLISLSDTAHIIGDLQLGVIRLSRTPLNNPYIVDNKQIYSYETTLNAGKHQIIWEGGSYFSSLDTIVDIFPGKLTVINFSPQRLYGKLSVTPEPADAEIIINGRSFAFGTLTTSLATGTYTCSVRRSGYYPSTHTVIVEPDRLTEISPVLVAIPDADKDGFLDSVDLCPQTYGLYSGCPQQKTMHALGKYKTVFLGNLNEQSLTVSLTSMNWLGRTPTNQVFKQFLSYYNDGLFLFNNLNGLSFFNAITVSGRGFCASVELGQYFLGAEYKKDRYNNLLLITKQDTYCVWYDTSALLQPTVTLPSTSFSLGICLEYRGFTITNSIGYQWEDIRIDDLVTVTNRDLYKSGALFNGPFGIYSGPRVTVIYDNDWICYKMKMQYKLLTLKRQSIAFFGSFAIAIHPRMTGWYCAAAGFTHNYIFGQKPSGRYTR
ncbi:MAG: PEGA domain-containing protein [Chitinivibrionales bacterium]|nr:PEGA domain-containing protein [Chitinivibrionales bacterium]